MRVRAGFAAMILAALGFATSSRAGCTIGTVAELPVTMEGGQPTVATTINGAEARFVANTGAGFSIIFDRPAQALHLPRSDSSLQLEVTGLAGVAAPWATSVKRFGLGSREISNVTFVVAGHEAVPEAIGFLGQNILGATDTEYDLANGVIRLMQPKGCGKANLAYWVKEGPYSMMPWATRRQASRKWWGQLRSMAFVSASCSRRRTSFQR